MKTEDLTDEDLRVISNVYLNFRCVDLAESGETREACEALNVADVKLLLGRLIRLNSRNIKRRFYVCTNCVIRSNAVSVLSKL